VSSLLRQVLLHLLKLVTEPDIPSREHWLSEILTFHSDALLVFTPGMKQRIDLDRVWKTVQNTASRMSADKRIEIPMLPADCPLTLDELLAANVDPDHCAQIMEASIRATARSSG
jgi:hypothetical protein